MFNNIVAMALTMVIALTWFRINDFFAHKISLPTKGGYQVLSAGKSFI